MPELPVIQKIIIWAIPVLFAITVHEVAHGWVANQLGDPTAKLAGRLTLNPVKHIDLLGTIILPLILLYIGNFIFGWAKPVPVGWQNLGKPRRDMALVAAAGPVANLLMIIIWAMLAKSVLIFATGTDESVRLFIYMCSAGIIINIILMVLNLFPLLPLDGGRIVAAMLPLRLARMYSRLEPYGLLILIIFLVSGVLGKLLFPIVRQLEIFVYQLI
jgi:Zn-dependent protease